MQQVIMINKNVSSAVDSTPRDRLKVKTRPFYDIMVIPIYDLLMY